MAWADKYIQWEVDADSPVVNANAGASFAPMRLHTDLVIQATTTDATSALYPFTTADIGKTYWIVAGTNFTVQTVTLNSIVSGVIARFSAALGTAGSTGGNAVVLGPGTDYTQGAGAALISYTDLASVSPWTTLTSAIRPFVIGDIGNCLYITDGVNFAVNRYWILDVVGGAAILDRACGATGNASAGVALLGGCSNLPGPIVTSALFVKGNICFVQGADSYALGAASLVPLATAGGNTSVQTRSGCIVGYNTTRTVFNKDAIRPTLTGGVDGYMLDLNTAGAGWILNNFIIQNTSTGTGSYCMRVQNNTRITRVHMIAGRHGSTAVSADYGAYDKCSIACSATGSTAIAISNAATIDNCTAYATAGSAGTALQGRVVTNSKVYGPFDLGISVLALAKGNCVIRATQGYSSGGSSSSQSRQIGNLSVHCTKGYSPHNRSSMYIEDCYSYNDTTVIASGVPVGEYLYGENSDGSTGIITLTSNPFVGAVPATAAEFLANDLSLNDSTLLRNARRGTYPMTVTPYIEDVGTPSETIKGQVTIG